MYEPKPTIKLNNPGTYTVTDDYPLAVDYQFVCWEDENGTYYHAGDKIYIDGQKTLYAVWEPKTDGRNRVIRVITTAFETLKRTFQAFFGFFDVEVEYDALADENVNKNFFDLDGLLVESHVFAKNKRYYEIGVDPVAEGVVYEPFSRTEEIYFGGSLKNVEEEVPVIDEETGKVIGSIFQGVTKFEGATKYSALYEMTDRIEELEVKDYEGNVLYTKKCQIIRVTLTDGVPDPITGQYITFVLPKGIIRYTAKTADGDVLMANNTFAFYRFTTPNI